jgi:hypothetical protein
MGDEVRGLHITLVGPGISIDREVPEHLASQVIRLLLESGAGHQGERASIAMAPAAEAPRSLAELFAEAEPKRNPDKIAVIAHHMKLAGQGTVTKADVRSGFRRAGEREPRNFDRDWNWAIRNGWIDGDSTRGFYITRSGQQAVADRFSGKLIDRTKLRPIKASRAKSTQALKPDVS